MTDPEIVDDAYAFDNPCFKDATPAVARSLERPISATPMDTPAKDSTRWSTPWSSLGIGNGNRNDKRRTLDDSCLGVIYTFFSHNYLFPGFIYLVASEK